MSSLPKKADAAVPSSTGGTKTATQRRRFVIPKKPDSDGKREIDLHSREFQTELLPIIQEHYLYPDSVHKITFNGGYHLHNSKLHAEYQIKRSDLSKCRAEKELTETYAFFGTKFEGTASAICKYGMNMGNIPSSACNLGNCKMGITFQKHSDVLWYKEPEKGTQHYMIVCKIIKGRIKFVPDSSSHLEPTPNYDCHMSKNLSSGLNKKSEVSSLFRSTQIYMYEYNEDSEIVKPRQAYPIALLFYQYDNVAPIPKKLLPNLSQNSKPTSKISNAGPLGITIWNGKLINKSKVIAKASLISYSIKFRPVLFGKNVFLTQSLPLKEFRKKYLKQLQRISIRREMHAKDGFLLYTQLRSTLAFSFKELMAYLKENQLVAVWCAGKRVEGFVIPDLPCLRELGFPDLSAPNARCHCLFYSPYSMASRLKVPKGPDDPNGNANVSSDVNDKEFENGFLVSCPQRSLLSMDVFKNYVLEEQNKQEQNNMFKELEAATNPLSSVPLLFEAQQEYYPLYYNNPSYNSSEKIPYIQSYGQNCMYGYTNNIYEANLANQSQVQDKVNTKSATTNSLKIHPANNCSSSYSSVLSKDNNWNAGHVQSSQKDHSLKAVAEPLQTLSNKVNLQLQTKSDVPKECQDNLQNQSAMEITKNPYQTPVNNNISTGITQVQHDDGFQINYLQNEQIQTSLRTLHVASKNDKSPCNSNVNSDAITKIISATQLSAEVGEDLSDNIIGLDQVGPQKDSTKEGVNVEIQKKQNRKRDLNGQNFSYHSHTKYGEFSLKKPNSCLQDENQISCDRLVEASISSTSENAASNNTQSVKSVSSPKKLCVSETREVNILNVITPFEHENEPMTLISNESKESQHSCLPNLEELKLKKGSKEESHNCSIPISDFNGQTLCVIASSEIPEETDNLFSKVGSNWESSLLRKENESIPFLSNSEEPPKMKIPDLELNNQKESVPLESNCLEEQPAKVFPRLQDIKKVNSTEGEAVKLILVDISTKKPITFCPDIMRFTALDTSGSIMVHGSLNVALQDAMKNFQKLQNQMIKTNLPKTVCDGIAAADKQSSASYSKLDNTNSFQKLSSFSTIFNEMGNHHNKCEAIDELKDEVTKFTEGIMTKIANNAVTPESTIKMDSRGYEKRNQDEHSPKKRSFNEVELESAKKRRLNSADMKQPSVKEDINSTEEILHEEMHRFYDVFSLFLATSSPTDEHEEFASQKIQHISLSKLRVIKEYGDNTEADKFINYTVKAGIKRFLFMLDKLLSLLEYFPFEELEEEQELKKNMKLEKKLLFDKIVSVVSKLTKDMSVGKEEHGKGKTSNAVLAKRCFSSLNKICCPNPKIDDVVDQMTIEVGNKLDCVIQEEIRPWNRKMKYANFGRSKESGYQNKSNPWKLPSSIIPLVKHNTAEISGYRGKKHGIFGKTSLIPSKSSTVDLVSIPLPEECPSKHSLPCSFSSPDISIEKLASFIADQTSVNETGSDNRMDNEAHAKPQLAKQTIEEPRNTKSLLELVKPLQKSSAKLIPKPTIGSRKVYKCTITNKRKLFLKKKKLHLERYYEYRRSLLQFVLMTKKVKKLAYTTAVCSKLRPKYQQMRQNGSAGKTSSSIRNIMLKVSDIIQCICHNKNDNFVCVLNVHCSGLNVLLKKLAKDVCCGNVHASTLKLAYHLMTMLKDSSTVDKGNIQESLNVSATSKIHSPKVNNSKPVSRTYKRC